jgi:hypothetical protein
MIHQIGCTIRRMIASHLQAGGRLYIHKAGASDSCVFKKVTGNGLIVELYFKRIRMLREMNRLVARGRHGESTHQCQKDQPSHLCSSW